MFQLNPFDLANAWWQHLLMLLVSGFIGYIVGFRNRNWQVDDLQFRLADIDQALAGCRKRLVAFTPIAKKADIDDLKVIEGIGPQIEKLLQKAGIRTYAKLSTTSREDIKKLLDSQGTRFQMHDPTTWPRQALLAESGQWEQLRQWQEALDGGKE